VGAQHLPLDLPSPTCSQISANIITTMAMKAGADREEGGDADRLAERQGTALGNG
jgi:hypothetical protein